MAGSLMTRHTVGIQGGGGMTAKCQRAIMLHGGGAAAGAHACMAHSMVSCGRPPLQPRRLHLEYPPGQPSMQLGPYICRLTGLEQWMRGGGGVSIGSRAMQMGEIGKEFRSMAIGMHLCLMTAEHVKREPLIPLLLFPETC